MNHVAEVMEEKYPEWQKGIATVQYFQDTLARIYTGMYC